MRNNIPRIAVGHVALNVSDLEVSEMFYQEILGFRVTEESFETPVRYASMAWNGKTVLTLTERSGGVQEERPALRHLAFEAESIQEVDRTRGLLENLGARWSEATALSPNAQAICFDDPDGVKIKVFHAPRANGTEEAYASIDSGARPPELECCPA